MNENAPGSLSTGSQEVAVYSNHKGVSLMKKLLLISALTVAGLAGQELSVCSLVTAADATAILGVSAKQTRDPSGCVWEDATHKMKLNIAYVNVPTMFESARVGSA